MDVSERSQKFNKLQVKIGGMQCSFCVESIRKAFLRMDGVSDVKVSLAHEEALISYDPKLVSPEKLKDTLLSLGYSVRDPDSFRIRIWEKDSGTMVYDNKAGMDPYGEDATDLGGGSIVIHKAKK